MNSNNLTPENLKLALWETLKSVKSKRLKPNEANAIVSNARAICSVTKLELEFHKAAGSKPNTKKMLS